MKNKFIIIGLLVVPAVLFASGHAEGGEATKYFAMTGRETDFVPRIFNFLIFAGVLYYLLADKLKGFLVSRQDAIAKQLKDIEDRLHLAKKQQKDAKALLKNSDKKAKEIVADAKKEALFLSDKIMQNNAQEILFWINNSKKRWNLNQEKALEKL